MTFKKIGFKAMYLSIAVLLAGILFTASPYNMKIIIQASQAQAIAASDVEIIGQYLRIDNQNLDIGARPALFIDSSCQDLLVEALLIPIERRPYIIVTADTQPGFMPADITYYWSSHTETRSPALVWYDQELIGYMYSAVEPQLYKMRYPLLIGEGKVTNVIHDGSSQNAARAAAQISGVVLKPGEIFSFYGHVVPSIENGYVEGLTLFNSEDGPRWMPDVGGGICTTATALNLAVQNAQLEVIERHHHTESVSYAEIGEDTAVARSGGWDYKYRNTTEKAIQIVGEQQGDYLEFKIYEILETKEISATLGK
ncbi:MAG: VanW family protein [Firmicutes bacterium]|nr:VanW family protein [Bacillota bacterium]